MNKKSFWKSDEAWAIAGTVALGAIAILIYGMT